MVEFKHQEVTDKILHTFSKKVYRKLGYGFLERSYENALASELRRIGLKVIQQAPIRVY